MNVVLAVGLFVVVVAACRWEWSFGLGLACVGVILASSSVPDVQSRFLTIRWGGVLAMAVMLPRGRLIVRRHDLAFAVLAFCLFVSAAWSIEPRLTVERALSFSAVLWIAFVVTPRRTAGVDLCRLPIGVSVVPLLLILTTLALWLFDPETGIVGNTLRGLLDGSNGLGLLLAITWPLLAAAARALPLRGLELLSFVIVAVLVTLSVSRSGIVVLFVGLVVANLAQQRRRDIVVPVVILAAVAGYVAVASPQLADFSVIRPHTQQSSVIHQGHQLTGTDAAPGQSTISAVTGARSEAWAAASRLIVLRPLGGYGFGTGDRVFDDFPSETHFRFFSGASQKGTNPHSAFLQALMELGVPLGVIFLAPLLVAAWAGLRFALAAESSICGAYTAAAFVAAIVGAAFESILAAAGGAFSLLIWVLAAALIVHAYPSLRCPVEGGAQ